MKQKNKIFIWFFSIALILIVGYLLSPRSGRLPYKQAGWLQVLPHLNGTINTLVSISLVLGLIAIKRKKKALHKRFMLTAVFLSIIFLISYVTYHYFVQETHFKGSDTLKIIYYIVLISHILLAMISVPLVLFALFYAFQKNFNKHKKIVKFAYPIWLYVAISGVLVYLLISPYYGS